MDSRTISQRIVTVAIRSLCNEAAQIKPCSHEVQNIFPGKTLIGDAKVILNQYKTELEKIIHFILNQEYICLLHHKRGYERNGVLFADVVVKCKRHSKM